MTIRLDSLFLALRPFTADAAPVFVLAGPVLRTTAFTLHSIAIALSLQLLAMFWLPLGEVLGTSPVSTRTLWFCLGATACTVVVTELTKHVVALWPKPARRG